jgi:hypothetical protein
MGIANPEQKSSEWRDLHYCWERKGDARIILTNIKNYQLLDVVQRDVQFQQVN